MPSSGTTTNYNLPQYSGTDYPSFTDEITKAFATIDKTMKANATAAQAAQTAASAAAQAAQTAQSAAEAADAAATAAQTAADNAVNLLVDLGVTNEESAIAFKNLVDNAVPKHAIMASYFESE